MSNKEMHHRQLNYCIVGEQSITHQILRRRLALIIHTNPKESPKATTIRSGTKIDTLISYYQYLKKPLSHCYTCLMQKSYMISNNFKCSSTIIDCTGTRLMPTSVVPPTIDAIRLISVFDKLNRHGLNTPLFFFPSAQLHKHLPRPNISQQHILLMLAIKTISSNQYNQT